MEVIFMTQYIIFLRGVNVSGKNRVSMSLLKEALILNGFHDVQSYINSGNILVTTDILNLSVIKEKSESIIRDAFLLEIPVFVISVNELKNILTFAPEWWGDGNREVIHYAIFLIPPITIEAVYLALGDIKSEYEKVSHQDNVIFWSAPKNTFSKSRGSKLASSTVNNNITIRNSNTVNKMISLAT